MTDALLSISGLVLEDPTGHRILDGLDLQLEAGEFAALVGESGSGKSMAARAVLGLCPMGIRHTAGKIVFDGRNLTESSPTELRQVRGPGVGMVFQEPTTALNPAMTVGDQIAEGISLHHGTRGKQLRNHVVEMLTSVGIPEPEKRMDQWPHQFSGGMRQRIMLASVMALRPKLLIADEPTTALDSLTQAEIMELMRNLAQDGNAAVLLISHDLGLVARYAQKVHVLEKGKIVERGEAARVLSAPSHDYTKSLASALPRPKAARPIKSDQEPVVSSSGLVIRYDRRGWLRTQTFAPVLDGIDIKIHPGEVVALVGGSGSGKSTLGRALLRLLKISDGQVRFQGTDVSHARGRALAGMRAATQLIHQDPFDALDPRMTLAEIVAEALGKLGLSKANRLERATITLDRVGLGGFSDRYPHELSGGQRQRVAIARAIAPRPAFVVADEPVSALDMTVQRQVMALLAELQHDDGFACLFISHDFGAVMEIADRVVVLEAGHIVEEGPSHSVLTQPREAYTRRLVEASTYRPN